MSLSPTTVDFLNRTPKFGRVKYFVICDGKSGSFTLYQSFQNSLHAHSTGYLWTVHAELAKTRITLRQMQDMSRELYARKPWVILAVREPVGRTISAFFQNLSRFIPDQKNRNNEEIVLEKLEQNFVKLENYHTFDRNVYEDHVDGLDLYEQPFDSTKGYAVYETERLRIMVLKFEQIDKWSEIIPTLLMPDEIEDFRFVPSNLSSTKHSYSLQKAVTAKFRPSAAMVEAKLALHQKMLDHFYTAEERDSFRAKWIQ